MTNARNLAIGLIIGMVIAFTFAGRYIRDYKREARAITMDSIKTYRDALGREISSRSVIVADMENLKAENLALSGEARKLASMIDKKTVSATVIENVTTDTIEIPILVATEVDGLDVYAYQRATEWDTFDITAGPDTLIMSYVIRNEYELKQYWDRNIFKPDELRVEIKNLNPNTYTTGLASYHIPAKRGKFWIGVATGAAAGAVIAWRLTAL